MSCPGSVLWSVRDGIESLPAWAWAGAGAVMALVASMVTARMVKAAASSQSAGLLDLCRVTESSFFGVLLALSCYQGRAK